MILKQRNLRLIKFVVSGFISRYFLKFLVFFKPKRVGKALVIFIILLTVSLFFFRNLRPGDFFSPRISQGIIGVYSRESLPLTVANLLSEPLIVLDRQGLPQPKLASEWQINNNATHYTIKLKDDIFWNDGTSVKASDIQFPLVDVEIAYPDDKTIEFKLANPFSPFPTLLTTPVFKKGSLVGVGRFKVSRLDQSRGLITKLLLIPTADKDNGIGSPQTALVQDLPIISIRFYPDEKTAKTAFALGEIDSLIGASELSDIKNSLTLAIKQNTNFNKLVAIFFNTQDQLLKDKNLRKALIAATSKIDNEERAKTSIMPTSWAYNDSVKEILGHKDLTKAFLEKVDITQNQPLILTTTPALVPLAEKIVESWKQQSFGIVLRVESGIPQNFQALLISQPIPSDPDQYALWHSTQTKTNLSKYASPRIDKDLEDGRRNGNLEERKEKYYDFQKVLAEDAPAAFLYFQKTNILYRKRVENELNKILTLEFP